MSESSNEQTDGPDAQQDDGEGISDEQLPDDLLPSEDNPLAEPLSDEEAPDDIDELDMMGRADADHSEDADEDGDRAGDKAGDDGSGTAGEPPPNDDED